MGRGSGAPPKSNLIGPHNEPKRYVTRDELMKAVQSLARLADEKTLAWHREFVQPIIEWSQMPWWKRLFYVPKPTSIQNPDAPVVDQETADRLPQKDPEPTTDIEA